LECDHPDSQLAVTLAVIMPVNNRLMEIEPNAASADSRRLIEKWARQHAVRTGLGFAAVLFFLWASLS
jgi:hypothetical protein